MKVKQCSQCWIVKTLDCFHICKKGKYGVNAACKECKFKKAQDSQNAFKEKTKYSRKKFDDVFKLMQQK